MSKSTCTLFTAHALPISPNLDFCWHHRAQFFTRMIWLIFDEFETEKFHHSSLVEAHGSYLDKGQFRDQTINF